MQADRWDSREALDGMGEGEKGPAYRKPCLTIMWSPSQADSNNLLPLRSSPRAKMACHVLLLEYLVGG
jgi:hypothetical protein